MLKQNIHTLSGIALDWAVAKCEGAKEYPTLSTEFAKQETRDLLLYMAKHGTYSPSSDWSLAGPIIEREEITIYRYTCEEHRSPLIRWKAEYPKLDIYGKGETPLVAAMRCYVMSKLGDSIDIPVELL